MSSVPLVRHLTLVLWVLNVNRFCVLCASFIASSLTDFLISDKIMYNRRKWSEHSSLHRQCQLTINNNLQSFYASHIIPSESAVLSLIASHCELMSSMRRYSMGTSLMMLAFSASKLLEVGASKLADNPTLTKKALDLIVPALVSASSCSD